eukprot:154165-Alexandrium_andersonii.AAC.1
MAGAGARGLPLARAGPNCWRRACRTSNNGWVSDHGRRKLFSARTHADTHARAHARTRASART